MPVSFRRPSLARTALVWASGTFSLLAPIGTVMTTTVKTPNADQQCAYCGSRIFDHDPVCVRDCTDDCGSPSYFCNYACLSAYIDENELTFGDACE